MKPARTWEAVVELQKNIKLWSTSTTAWTEPRNITQYNGSANPNVVSLKVVCKFPIQKLQTRRHYAMSSVTSVNTGEKDLDKHNNASVYCPLSSWQRAAPLMSPVSASQNIKTRFFRAWARPLKVRNARKNSSNESDPKKWVMRHMCVWTTSNPVAFQQTNSTIKILDHFLKY